MFVGVSITDTLTVAKKEVAPDIPPKLASRVKPKR